MPICCQNEIGAKSDPFTGGYDDGVTGLPKSGLFILLFFLQLLLLSEILGEGSLLGVISEILQTAAGAYSYNKYQMGDNIEDGKILFAGKSEESDNKAQRGSCQCQYDVQQKYFAQRFLVKDDRFQHPEIDIGGCGYQNIDKEKREG